MACGKKTPPKEPTITETVADAGPVGEADAEPAKPKTLAERLGSKEGIDKIAEAFVQNMLHNDATKKRFAKLSKERVEKFRANVAAQFCKLADGDCEYAGKPMKDAHKGMKITETEWNAAVSGLRAALNDNKVAEDDQSDFIARIGPIRDDIVEAKPKAKPKK